MWKKKIKKGSENEEVLRDTIGDKAYDRLVIEPIEDIASFILRPILIAFVIWAWITLI